METLTNTNSCANGSSETNLFCLTRVHLNLGRIRTFGRNVVSNPLPKARWSLVPSFGQKVSIINLKFV